MSDTCDYNLEKKLGESAEEIKQRFAEFKEKYKITDADGVAQNMERLLQDMKRRELIAQNQRLISAEKNTAVLKQAYRDVISKKGKNKGQIDAKKVQKNIRQIFQNVGDRAGALADQAHQFYLRALKETGMGKLMKTDNFQRDIYRAIMRPDKYKFADNSPVKIMADAIRKYNDWIHVGKTRAGYDIGYAQNYVSKQLHHADKIIGNERAWKEMLENSLDWEYMGIKQSDRAQALDDILQTITNPKDLIDGVYASKQVKSLYFKGPDEAFAYQKAFGADNLFDQLMKSMHVDTRNLAVAEAFGVKHDKNVDALLKDVYRRTREVDPKQANFDSIKREVDQAYDWLSGITSYGAPKTILGKTATAIRQVTDMSMLKATSVVTTITDMPFSAGTANTIFGGGVNGYAKKAIGISQDTIKLFASRKQQIEFADRIGMFASEVSPFSGQKFAREGTETGMSWKPLDRAHNASMIMTGLPRQAAAARLAGVKQLVMGFADVADTPFDKLYSGTRELFDELNINAKDWDLIRQYGVDDVDGVKMITPEKLRRELETGGPRGDTELAMKNVETINKYATLLRQASELGSPTGSVRLNAFKNAQSPDSVGGMMWRFALQYKTFPIAAGRTMSKMAEKGTLPQKFINLGMTGMTATALGGIVLQTRNYIDKGEFIDMDDKQAMFWTKAAVQGGFLSIAGDMALGQDYTRFSNIPSQVAGPALSGVVQDTAEIATRIRKGNLRNKDIKKIVKKNMPTAISKPVDSKIFNMVMEEL